MLEIFIDLPFPPTVNSYYGLTRSGIRYVTKKGKQFRADCCVCCHEQNAYSLSLDYALQLDVILYPPDRRRRDLDNYMKALQDALGTHSDLSGANVWEDDSLIDNLNIHRGAVTPSGKCSVRIRAHHGLIMPDSPDIWDHID